MGSYFTTSTHCFIFTDKDGPFRICFENMDTVQYETTYKNCINEAAFHRQQNPEIFDSVICSILSKFATRCFKVLQQKLHITKWDWRIPANCPAPACGPHAFFVDFAPICVATCSDSYAPYNCPSREIVQRCMCDTTMLEKYVLSGGQCIPLSQCPQKTNANTTVNDRNYTVGTDVKTSEECSLHTDNVELGGV